MTTVDKNKGCMFGLVVGDALGTTLEFQKRDSYEHITDLIGGGVFNLKAGEWTDDTSMALALADTLIYHGMEQIEILKNFTSWRDDGKFSHNNKCFDIGHGTSAAITQFIASDFKQRICGNPHPLNSGNGGIMRMAPAVLYANSNEEAVKFSKMQSETTHNSKDCLDYAGALGDELWRLINTDEDVKPTLCEDMTLKPRALIRSTGYVLDTYEASWWAVMNTNNFKDAVLMAVNLGDDADTVGAVCGQIAGAKYGFSSIPKEWVEKIAWRNYIMNVIETLID